MSAIDLSDIRDELDRQLDRLHAAMELFQLTIEPGKMTRAQRAIDAVLGDALNATDRMVAMAADLTITASAAERNVTEHLKT